MKNLLRMLPLLLPGVVACADSTGPSLAEEITVSGLVTDDGAPLAGIQVGLFWYLGAGTLLRAQPNVIAETGSDGRYDISLRVSVCAISRVYAYPNGVVEPWLAPLRGELLSGCGPHVSDIDGLAPTLTR